MKKNKKAIFYSVTILLFTIFILISALTAVFKKTSREKKIGEEQIDVIKQYQKGEDILFYIDQSAKYSLYDALYLFANNGTYFNEPICGYYLTDFGEYALWKQIFKSPFTQKVEEETCYPSENDLTTNFALFFNYQLDKYIKIYPSAIPKDNYDFNFNEEDNKLEIVGIATQSIILPEETQNFNYYLKPSFKIEINYNFIKKFKEYVEKTKEIEKSVVECLKIGSGEPYDTDLMTCADINNLKQVKEIENYKIIPLPDNGNYILLFTIEDPSFKNPYSDEKLVIKYGLRFLDKFPPLATEIVTDKENKPLKKDGAWYLIWQTNNASDVVGYKIYYKKIEKTLDGREIPPTPPTDIEKMDNKYDPIIIRAPLTEWPITGLEEGDYYFFIIAGDDANNVASDIITKRVTIPSIEEARKEETLILPIY